MYLPDRFRFGNERHKEATRSGIFFQFANVLRSYATYLRSLELLRGSLYEKQNCS